MNPVKRTVIDAFQVFTPAEISEDTRVLVEDSRIARVGPIQSDLESDAFAGHYLIPGFIDLQVNGTAGADAASADRESLPEMSTALARFGVTGFLPTLITDEQDRLLSRLETLARGVGDRLPGARALGIHLEGPFLNAEKRGAHPGGCVQIPTLQRFADLLAASDNMLQMLTLAPEVEGGLELIERARADLPIVALGHSMADYDTAYSALEAGANLGTHIFNAMAPLHHRKPGLVGALLDHPTAAVSLIADGIHLHPAVARLVWRCKGDDGVVLVSDAISAAGMPDGDYQLGDLQIRVREGVCRLEDGRLAGSTLTMDAAFRNLRDWLSHLPEDPTAAVVRAGSTLPADLLGVPKKGRIEEGADADLVLLDREFQVLHTWVEGRLVYSRDDLPEPVPEN